MINPEDADGGGSSVRTNTIRLLRSPGVIVVKSNSTIAAASVKKGITVGDAVYINNVGYITTEKPDDLASIIGIVISVDNCDVKLSVEPGIAIAYDHVVEHNGGMVTDDGYFDRNRTIAYNDEDRLSKKPKTVEKIGSKKGGKKKGGEVKTTIDEDLMNALIGD